jgi:hypothetical protein
MENYFIILIIFHCAGTLSVISATLLLYSESISFIEENNRRRTNNLPILESETINVCGYQIDKSNKRQVTILTGIIILTSPFYGLIACAVIMAIMTYVSLHITLTVLYYFSRICVEFPSALCNREDENSQTLHNPLHQIV